jgi:hypothetical protein
MTLLELETDGNLTVERKLFRLNTEVLCIGGKQ